MKTASELLSPETAEWWAKLGGKQAKAAGHFLETMDSYGTRLAKIHLHKYLKPFQVTTKNIGKFTVDSCITPSCKILFK